MASKAGLEDGGWWVRLGCRTCSSEGARAREGGVCGGRAIVVPDAQTMSVCGCCCAVAAPASARRGHEPREAAARLAQPPPSSRLPRASSAAAATAGLSALKPKHLRPMLLSPCPCAAAGCACVLRALTAVFAAQPAAQPCPPRCRRQTQPSARLRAAAPCRTRAPTLRSQTERKAGRLPGADLPPAARRPLHPTRAREGSSAATKHDDEGNALAAAWRRRCRGPQLGARRLPCSCARARRCSAARRAFFWCRRSCRETPRPHARRSPRGACGARGSASAWPAPPASLVPNTPQISTPHLVLVTGNEATRRAGQREMSS